jgi:hypothetical protein
MEGKNSATCDRIQDYLSELNWQRAPLGLQKTLALVGAGVEGAHG